MELCINLESTRVYMKPYLWKAILNQGEHHMHMETSPHKGGNTKRSTSGKQRGSREQGMKRKDGMVGLWQAGV